RGERGAYQRRVPKKFQSAGRALEPPHLSWSQHFTYCSIGAPMEHPEPARPVDDAAIYAIERPDKKLLRYYAIRSLLAGLGFPFLLVYSYFRYHTMRYHFDEQGVKMSWGILFRREINLTYARIQDIHLSSNIVERWLGLARIQVQTASGSSGAEMIIE